MVNTCLVWPASGWLSVETPEGWDGDASSGQAKDACIFSVCLPPHATPRLPRPARRFQSLDVLGYDLTGASRCQTASKRWRSRISLLLLQTNILSPKRHRVR